MILQRAAARGPDYLARLLVLMENPLPPLPQTENPNRRPTPESNGDTGGAPSLPWRRARVHSNSGRARPLPY